MSLITLPTAAPAIPSFGQFADLWVEQMRPQWKASYLETVQCTLRLWLLPTFASWSLDQIDRAALLRFRAAVSTHARQPSPARVNKIMAILQACLAEAARQHAMDNTPLSLRPLRESARDIQPLTLAQMRHLLSLATPQWRDYYIVRFLTGLRTGEIDGLLWRYVDFDKRQILVRETIVRASPDTPKTPASAREVDLVPDVLQALIRQRERTGKLNGYVFCARNGSALRHGNVRRRVWLPLLQRAGLAPRRQYETRHTYATLMLAAGENPEYVRRQMGHTDAQMLFQVYSRYVPNLTRRDGTAFCGMLDMPADASPVPDSENTPDAG